MLQMSETAMRQASAWCAVSFGRLERFVSLGYFLDIVSRYYQ